VNFLRTLRASGASTSPPPFRNGTLLRYIAEGNLPEPESPAPEVWSAQNRR
jgi:hypothetical protein